MKKLEWFVTTLKDEFDVSVEKEDIGYEETELYVNELDEALLPAELLEGILETLLLETMVADDVEGNEWIGCLPSRKSGMADSDDFAKRGASAEKSNR